MKSSVEIYHLLLVMLCIMAFNQACTNLDEKVYSTITEDNFFQTEEQLIAAFGAAYTNLYSGMANKYGIISVQGSPSDEMVTPTRGGDWEDGGEWVRVHTHNFDNADGIFNTVWNFIFGGVGTCNKLIATFQEVDSDLADNAIAELRGLRALYYYWAIDMFGNVPIVDSFADVENPPTKTRQEVYDFLVKELNEISPLLTKEVNSNTYGRVTYWVAQAILAKVYLNAEVYTGTAQWDLASATCDTIINSGMFNLSSDFFSNFTEEPISSSEILMAVPYDRDKALGNNLHYMSLHYQNQQTYGFDGQPWNGFCSLQEFYESFEDDDVRKGSFLEGQQYDKDGNVLKDALYEKFNPDNPTAPKDPDGEKLVFTPKINQLSPGCLRQAGVRIGKYEFQEGVDSDLDTDVPIFRYADILLMKGEALMRAGKGGEGLPYVNEVRARAGVSDFSELTEENMLAERGREFFAEGHRRSDLIRFGKFNDTWWEKDASGEHTKLFPIPFQQMQANPNLKQNDGY